MFCRGDHIRVKRHSGIYFHHGVYIGDLKVVHYTGESIKGKLLGTEKENPMVRIDPIHVFADGNKDVELVEHPTRLNRDLTVSRAMSRVGERHYNLTFNNCEHFAAWCVAGETKSDQLPNVVEKGGRLLDALRYRLKSKK